MLCNKKNKNVDNRKKASEQVPVHSTRERRGSVFFFKNRPGMLFVAPGCHASLSPLVVAPGCHFDRRAEKGENLMSRFPEIPETGIAL
jgi:hypothetical protein